MSDKQTAAKETLPVKAIDAQITNLVTQLDAEKAKLANIEDDKSKVNKAHAFLVGQNPNTPAGPKCMRLLDTIESAIKNQSNAIVNIENMLNSCKAQAEYELTTAVIHELSRKYEV